MNWIREQFPTRIIALMPVAIAINIVLGATVQQALKLPIYLDSIGTILVGVLAMVFVGLLLHGALGGLVSFVLAVVVAAVIVAVWARVAAQGGRRQSLRR